ncbi:alpha-1,2-glucosyltransferase [Thioploca ingrica]|uniref:Alpha-1,2-glucosyltransferase n=1 Tax=Thioploca ingrica TaxID=40754 RepID=A0A090BVM6_9GAMM|nr:alpha-1,2-glucosyltransferase [Thioploca ingrica]
MDNREYKAVTIVFLLVLLTFALAFTLVKNVKPIVDEGIHYLQIKFILDFFNGEQFIIHPTLTMIPGYHFVMASLSYIFDNLSVAFIRSLSTVFSYISIIIFFLLLKSEKSYPQIPVIKLIQYAFFPLIFPFFFLIYTDSFSVLLILFSWLLVLNKRYYIGGIIATASVLVRQSNLIWLIFMITYIYYENNQFKFNLAILANWIKDCWTFFLGIVFFSLFVLVNGGMIIGKGATQYYPKSLYFGNIYFFLFLFFFLFLPLNIDNRHKIQNFIKVNPWIMIGIVAFFIFYLLTFNQLSPHNLKGEDRLIINYFLRNEILITFTSSTLFKILFFIPVVYSLLSIAITQLCKKSYYLLYPFAILSVVPIWPIFPRYSLIPFILFILFKETNSKLIEYSTTAIYVVLSMGLFYGMLQGWFYPG